MTTMPPPEATTCICTLFALACLQTLFRASCTMRKMQVLCSSGKSSGMVPALTRTQTPPRFEALSATEKAYLFDWRQEAQEAGIDAVDDMMGRPWPCPVADVIIGVFKAGEDRAAWLVIGYNGLWAVASCIDGAVSRSVKTLAEALALIHPWGFGRARTA